MPKSQARPSPLHSIEQMAEHCEVSTKTIRRWIAAGDLHAHHLGRQIRISQEDMVAFLAARRR